MSLMYLELENSHDIDDIHVSWPCLIDRLELPLILFLLPYDLLLVLPDLFGADPI